MTCFITRAIHVEVLDNTSTAEIALALRRFWRQKQNELPMLARIAAGLLVTPATSVDCERLFGSAGMLYGNKRRQRLTGRNAKNLLMVATYKREEIDYSRSWSDRYSTQLFDFDDEDDLGFDYDEDDEDDEDDVELLLSDSEA
ncbi:unnamed protein product [Auanema sp. JU1783]|nr:unnamed protein product [Auanema sp. JU1783]